MRRVGRSLHRCARATVRPTASAVNVENLTVRYGENVALGNVSAGIPPRALTAVIGPAGSGKTTLLKAMWNELPAGGGSVFIQDLPARLWPPKKREACLYACPAIRPELCPLRSSDTCTGPVDAIAFREALGLLGFRHLEGRAGPDLSERDRGRVELALTIAPFLANARPRASHLWLDDPLDGMDRLHQHRFLRWLQSTAHRRQTTLVTAADDTLMRGYADKVILLSRGTVIAQGSPRTVLSSANLTVAFGGLGEVIVE